jgi:hypothetical protein
VTSNTTTDGSSITNQEAHSPFIPFSDWLRTFAKENAPIGDLARDFIIGADEGHNDSHYPTPESFLEMLNGHSACNAAIETFEEAAEWWSELTGVPLATEEEDEDQ